jgi:hypothetical protein
MLLDLLLEGEKFGKTRRTSGLDCRRVRMRDALAEPLDDITEGSRAIAAIVNRDGEGGTK